MNNQNTNENMNMQNINMDYKDKQRKNILVILVLLFILILVIIFRKPISNFVIEKILFSKEIYLEEPNEYTLDYNFLYVQSTDDFIADNKQDVLNIFYTALNNGYSNFYFYCNYNNCQNDVYEITEPENLVNISNYVHPFNSYRKVYVSSNSFDKVSVRIEKAYTVDNIDSVNQKLDELIAEIITDEMTDKEKIITFHDYIIDHTIYDSDYIASNLNDIDSPSHKALGPLFYGRSLCGGYSDVMALFLNRLHLPNYRISSDDHIWNFVYLDNNWYHLDLTWDDPVTDSKENIKLDTFLLISTKQLEELNTNYHIYAKTIYPEAK